jgi:ABC-type branched-subunit amino acid transport system permease subunit
MLRFIAATGKEMLSFAFGLTVIAGAVAGGYFGYTMTGEEATMIALAGIGAFIGILIGGVLYGPLAALFEINDNLRRLANRAVPETPESPRQQIEPRLA